MKILFISHDDGKYGAAICLLDIVEYLMFNKKVEITVITRKYNEINRFCDENNIENHVLNYVSCITKHESNLIKQYFNKFIQNLKSYIMNHICLHKIVSLIDISEFDYIYTNVSTIDFGYELAIKYNIKHCWHIREFGLEDMNAVPASIKLINKINSSDIVITISNSVRNAWIEKGINPKKIDVIYDGVKDNIIFKRKENINNHRIIHLIFMGSSSPHKGIEQLLEALSICEKKVKYQLLLHVYGNYKNDYGVYIKSLIQKLCIEENVIFEGFCKDINKRICNHDIGFVCSKSEGFGRVTIEYMLAGVPVIASNTGANLELIKNYENGILYEYNNPQDLAEKICILISNTSLINKIVNNARNYAVENFTLNKNVETIYEKLNLHN